MHHTLAYRTALAAVKCLLRRSTGIRLNLSQNLCKIYVALMKQMVF